MARHQIAEVLRTLLLLPLLLGSQVQTATAQSEIFVRITGTIIGAAPCKINGGRVIEVNFGDDVVTARVDGTNYKQLIDYSLECVRARTNSMRFKIEGRSAVFSSNVLATTERTNLGIMFWNNDNPLAVNSWINFQYPIMPILKAAPVKAQGSQLSTGKFSAGATLLVEYQ